MDPDRWEFANEWFLREQKQLLVNIARKKQSKSKQEELLMEEEVIVMEIARLREEQKALEKEVERMHKRLEATERRPHQMISFLRKVAEDPDVVSRILLERERRQLELGEKKRRLMLSPPATTSSSSSSGMAVKTEVDDDEATVGGMISSSPETGFQVGSPPPQDAWGRRQVYVGQASNGGAAVPTPLTAVPVWSPLGGSYFVDMATESNPPPPYPFSLLEGGF